MRLSPPSFVIFLISFLVALLIVLTKYFGINVPFFTDLVSGKKFEFLLFAYVLLFAGVVFRGL